MRRRHVGALALLTAACGACPGARADPGATVVELATEQALAGAAPQVFTGETLAYWDYRALLARQPPTRGSGPTGPSMIGINVGDRARLASSDLPEHVVESLRGWDGWGALVLSVHPGSPAESAWLEQGDVIVRFGGMWVDGPEALIQLVTRTTPGAEQELWYLRDGQVYSTWIVPRPRDVVIADAQGVDSATPIEGIVLEPGTKHLVLPEPSEAAEVEYPRAAADEGAGGLVQLDVLVRPDGVVGDVAVTAGSGRADLDAAAVKALAVRAYVPGRYRGRPVAVKLPVAVGFQADGPPSRSAVVAAVEAREAEAEAGSVDAGAGSGGS